jgi:hypothetical protein
VELEELHHLVHSLVLLAVQAVPAVLVVLEARQMEQTVVTLAAKLEAKQPILRRVLGMEPQVVAVALKAVAAAVTE